jgi:hypothetical protein
LKERKENRKEDVDVRTALTFQNTGFVKEMSILKCWRIKNCKHLSLK